MKEYKIDLSMYEGKVRELVSDAVQEKAFELGHQGWAMGGKAVQFSNAAHLFFEKSGLVFGNNKQNYEKTLLTEISASDFLALAPEDVQDAPKEPEFKPFDQVLVRDDCDKEWHIDFFERMNNKDEAFRYMCLNAHWCHCIPYEGNEHLLGTTEEPK